MKNILEILVGLGTPTSLPKNINELTSDLGQQRKAENYAAKLKYLFVDVFKEIKFENQTPISRNSIDNISASNKKISDFSSEQLSALQEVLMLYTIPSKYSRIEDYVGNITNAQFREAIFYILVTSIICVKRSETSKADLTEDEFSELLNKDKELNLTPDEIDFLNTHFYSTKENFFAAQNIDNNLNDLKITNTSSDNAKLKGIHEHIERNINPNVLINNDQLKESNLIDFMSGFESYSKQELINALKAAKKINQTNKSINLVNGLNNRAESNDRSVIIVTDELKRRAKQEIAINSIFASFKAPKENILSIMQSQIESIVSKELTKVGNDQKKLRKYCQAIKDILAEPFKHGKKTTKTYTETQTANNQTIITTYTLPYYDISEYETLGAASLKLHAFFKLYAYPSSLYYLTDLNVTNFDVRKTILQSFVNAIEKTLTNNNAQISDNEKNKYLADNFVNKADIEDFIQTSCVTASEIHSNSRPVSYNRAFLIKSFIKSFENDLILALDLAREQYKIRSAYKLESEVKWNTLSEVQKEANNKLIENYQKDYDRKFKLLVLIERAKMLRSISVNGINYPLTQEDRELLIWELEREASLANIKLDTYQAYETPEKLFELLTSQEINKANKDAKDKVERHMFLNIWFENSYLAFGLYKLSSSKIFPLDYLANVLLASLKLALMLIHVPVNFIKFAFGKGQFLDTLRPFKHLFVSQFVNYSSKDKKITYMQAPITEIVKNSFKTLVKGLYGAAYGITAVPYRAYKYLYQYIYKNNLKDFMESFNKNGLLNKETMTHVGRIIKALVFSVGYPLCMQFGLRAMGFPGIFDSLITSALASKNLLSEFFIPTSMSTTVKYKEINDKIYTIIDNKIAYNQDILKSNSTKLSGNAGVTLIISIVEQAVSKLYYALPKKAQHYVSYLLPYYDGVEKDYPQSNVLPCYNNNENILDSLGARVLYETKKNQGISI